MIGVWSRAKEMAATTPEGRNRYVDFLRAVSILFVISGHWLITTAQYGPAAGSFTPVLALDVIPWTNWLTWMFQVMPIFFIVGGYSNAVSLDVARRKNLDYPAWLAGRLQRLLTPLLVLVLFWGATTTVLHVLGVAPEDIRFISRTALVPTWFLAIYTMIVLLAPAAHAVWRRWGFTSLAVLVGLAGAADWAFFQLGWTFLGWTNYFWVWLAVHHLGFAWRDARLGTPAVLLGIALGSLLLLLALVLQGPYPVAMAASPGEEVSNSLPPKITLFVLGLAQFGLLLALERPAQRLLAGVRAWAATILVNSMIMTLYLWHMTVLVGLFALSYASAGTGLHVEPGSVAWWWMRPAWLLALGLGLIPVALTLSPLERLSASAATPVPSTWRLLAGAMMSGLGLTLATLLGLDGNQASWSHSAALLLLVGGALTCGIGKRGARR